MVRLFEALLDLLVSHANTPRPSDLHWTSLCGYGGGVLPHFANQRLARRAHHEGRGDGGAMEGEGYASCDDADTGRIARASAATEEKPFIG